MTTSLLQPCPLIRVLFTAGAALLALALSGCASPWETNFVREAWAPSSAPSVPGAPAPALQELPWERMQAALETLHRDLVASDRSPAEWPADQRAAENARLLQLLQVSDDPARAAVLGHSAFTSTTLFRPESGDSRALESFGARLGARKVVWSRSLMGKTEEIVDRPVTSTTTTDVTRIGPGRRARAGTWTQSSTTWVPMRVNANEYGYAAFFVR